MKICEYLSHGVNLVSTSEVNDEFKPLTIYCSTFQIKLIILIYIINLFYFHRSSECESSDQSSHPIFRLDRSHGPWSRYGDKTEKTSSTPSSCFHPADREQNKQRQLLLLALFISLLIIVTIGASIYLSLSELFIYCYYSCTRCELLLGLEYLHCYFHE